MELELTTKLELNPKLEQLYNEIVAWANVIYIFGTPIL
jgi:hypothetical protein